MTVTADAALVAQGLGQGLAEGDAAGTGAALQALFSAPRLLAVPAQSQVLFEAPHRIEELFAALAQAAPARRVTVCRELTKQFETVAPLAAADLPAWLAADEHRRRGEFVLVLHAQPAPAAHGLPAAALHALDVLLPELPLKQAVATLSGRSADEVAKTVAFVMSGRTERGHSPHCLVFETRDAPAASAPAGRATHAIGVAMTTRPPPACANAAARSEVTCRAAGRAAPGR